MSPGSDVPALVLAALVGGMAASLLLWVWLLRDWHRGGMPPAWRPRRPVPWNVLHVLGAVWLLLVLNYLAVVALGVDLGRDISDLTIDDARLRFLATSLAGLGTFAAGVALLHYAAGATADDLGVGGTWPQWLADVRLGGLTFLAALAPVYAVQVMIVQIQPSTHPLLELLQRQPTPGILLAVAFSAVIAAPLYEEFLFRLVLQGWLERLEVHWRQATRPAAPRAAADDSAAADDGADHRPPHGTGDDPSDAAPGETPTAAAAAPLPLGPLPVAGSATAFALMHLGHGLDPIPLVLLAVLLGFVYQRTHRLLPCVVAHMLFNGFSLALALLSL